MFQLEKGIFIENKNTMLEWGKSVEKLALANDAEIIVKGDRTVVNWGTHKILDGLNIELTNTFLLLTDRPIAEKFRSIESWAVGDTSAKKHFDIISKHLIEKIGEPTKKSDMIDEEFWIWSINGVNISLNLFEQHAFKTCLTIEQV